MRPTAAAHLSSRTLRAGIAALCLLAVAGVTAWFVRHPQHGDEPPPAPDDGAAGARRYADALGTAQKALADGKAEQAVAALEGCEPSRRGWEWYALQRLSRGMPPAVELGSSEGGPLVTYLASGGGRVAFLLGAGTETARLRVHDLRTGRLLLELPPVGEAGPGKDFRLHGLSPDGRQVALGTPTQVFTHNVPVQMIDPFPRRYDPLGLPGMADRSRPLVVVGVRPVQEVVSGSFINFDVLTREVLAEEKAGMAAVAFSPDGRRFARANEVGGVQVSGGEPGLALTANGQKAVTALAFSPDGAFLAAGCNDGSYLVWELSTKKVVAGPFELKVGGVGVRVQIKDRQVCVTELVKGGAAEAHGGIRVNDIIEAAANPEGEMVPLEGAALEEFTKIGRGQPGEKVRLRVKPVAGGEARTVEITRAVLPNLGVGRLAFSPDGKQLAAVVNGSVAVRAWASGRQTALIHGVGWPATWTPDGRLLLARTGQVIVVETENGRELCALPGLADTITGLACLDNGKLAVVGHSGKSLTCRVLDTTGSPDDRPAAAGEAAQPRPDVEEALADLTAVIDAGKALPKTERARLLYQRGLLRAEKGDYAAAKRDLDAAFALDESLRKASRRGMD
jgi:hypothetical protein